MFLRQSAFRAREINETALQSVFFWVIRRIWRRELANQNGEHQASVCDFPDAYFHALTAARYFRIKLNCIFEAFERKMTNARQKGGRDDWYHKNSQRH